MQQILSFCLLVLAFSVSAVVTDDTPQIIFSPAVIDFGNVQLGDTKQIISYLTNIGNTSLVMYGAGGAPDLPFYAAQNCQDTTLNPGESCETFFNFTPSALGPATDASVGDYNNKDYRIPLTGNGVAREYLSIGPSMLDFGDVQLGDSKQKTIYITNISDDPIVMKGTGGGPYPPFYAVQNCQDHTFNPGESCELTITFTPNTLGSAFNASQGTYNGQSYNISLTGNVIAQGSQLSIAPSTLDFGLVKVGSSAKLIAYVTNTGDATITISSAGGAPQPPFKLDQFCQGKTLKSGESCELHYTYAPKAAGPFNGISVGSYNDQSVSVTLTGTTS